MNSLFSVLELKDDLAIQAALLFAFSATLTWALLTVGKVLREPDQKKLEEYKQLFHEHWENAQQLHAALAGLRKENRQQVGELVAAQIDCEEWRRRAEEAEKAVAFWTLQYAKGPGENEQGKLL